MPAGVGFAFRADGDRCDPRLWCARSMEEIRSMALKQKGNTADGETMTQEQRMLLEHEYRTELPFPVSTSFYHFSCSQSAVVRAQSLVRAVESTLRYAAIVVALDYASDPAADVKTLKWLRDRWMCGKRFALGDWRDGLLLVLRELRKTTGSRFVPEFGEVRVKELDRRLEPLVAERNTIIHGEVQDAGKYREFARKHDESLFFILGQLEFLRHYPLCFAELEDDDETPRPGTPQRIQVCRGASRTFVQQTVTPSAPIPPGVPFVWNRARRGILLLTPLFIYGGADVGGAGREGGRVRAHFEGLMVLNSARDRETYTSLDEQARFDRETITSVETDAIRKQLDTLFVKGADLKRRLDVALDDEEERRGFGRQQSDLPRGETLTSDANVKYVLEDEPIGRGGMGVVYLARREPDAGERFALKAMPLELMAVGSLVKRFERESRLLKTLGEENNPNIVRLIDTGRHKGFHFMVLEYVPGGSLADELWRRSGRGSPYMFAEALEIIRQVCNGIGAIHRMKVIHRDLKPGNILLRAGADDGSQPVVAKVTDLGLARRIGDQSMALTMEQGALGTFAYMAPEQFGDTPFKVDLRADVYAIGKILAQMLTGVVPKNAEELDKLDFSRKPERRTETLGEKAVKWDYIDESQLAECERALELAAQGGLNLNLRFVMHNKGLVTAEQAEQFAQDVASRADADEHVVEPEVYPIDGVKQILTRCISKDPEDRFGSTEELMSALDQAAKIDEAGQSLTGLGITNADVRSAYGLARIGNVRARGSLLEWCARRDDERHEAAAVALGVLLERGRSDLIAAAMVAREGGDAERYRGLVHALSSVLRWQEDHADHARASGQPWLREIGSGKTARLQKDIRKAYVSDNIKRTNRRWYYVGAVYAVAVAVMAGAGSLLGSAYEANVLWRTQVAPAGGRAVIFFFGSMLAGILWAGPFALAHLYGRQFERPRRFLVIAALSVLAFVVATTGIGAFASAQGRAELAEAMRSPEAAGELLAEYFVVLSLLWSPVMALHFMAKEVPTLRRLTSSPVPAIMTFPIVVTAVSALSIPLFEGSGLLRHEVIGELGIVFGSGVGLGVADYYIHAERGRGGDRKRGPREGAVDVAAAPAVEATA